MRTDGDTPRPVLGIVGAGRAGSALAVALQDVGYRVAGVHSRNREDAATLAGLTGAVCEDSALAVVRRAELTLLTVPDTEITRVAATIAASGMALSGRGVVHCSARQTARVLDAIRVTGAQTGVLHPLQALAGAASSHNLLGSTFRLEGGGKLRGQLEGMVAALGGSRVEVPAAALDLYHAAAVLAGNAPLALLERASSLLEDAGIDPEAARAGLAALMEGAAANARRAQDASALTGPVARGDIEAISRHLEALAPDPAARELYRLLAREMAAQLSSDDPGRRRKVLELLAGAGAPGARPVRVA